MRPPPHAGLLLAACIGPLLVLVPILTILFEAVRIAPADASDLLFRPLVGQLLDNTVTLVAASTVSAALVGTAAAWCVERTRLPGRRAWAVLVAVPLAIPPFVTSYAWVSLSNDLQDFGGALLVVTSAYYPLVYLPVAATLRGMDPALEETARALGCSPARCFWRVVLPQLRPSLLGGMLLVALNALVEFGAFSLLRYRTFTTEIYAEYRTGFAGPGAALLAAVLVVGCLALLAGEAILRGRTRYARVGRFTRRPATLLRLGWTLAPVLAGLSLLVALTIGVPVGMVLYWLTQPGSAASSPVTATLAGLLSATFASVGFGLAAAGLTVALAIPLGFLAARHPGRAVMALERTSFLAQGVPGIVVALALVSIAVQVLRPLYQSAGLLVVAYAILFLPLALVGVRAAFAQAQRGLDEAARSLGLAWPEVFRRVLLPVAGPGLGAAAALVFVSTVTELTTTLLLSPIGTRTLATEVWVDTSTLAFAAAAPYAALMVTLSLLSTWLLVRRFGAGVAA
nr:iron ABC transporter permease [uncultured Lichenicoccus sp.]